ncbi:MAG: hypothetical protein V4484_06995 [Pseudomonadota bacterium]
MSVSEQTIAIDAAVEGMLLSQNLLDAGGAVLLPAGASLSTGSINSLRRRGIETVQVVMAAEPVDEAALLAERARQCERVGRLFRHSAGQGATAKLMAVLTSYRNGALT